MYLTLRNVSLRTVAFGIALTILVAVWSPRSFASQSASAVDDNAERHAPDFDGRTDVPPTAGETILWVPRIVLFPGYIVTEYVVRQPLRWLGRTLELNDVPFLVVDFFKFGEENQFLFLPTLLVDFGFRSSVGFYFRWKNFLGPGNRLSLRTSYGGSNYAILRLTDEIRIRDESFFRLSGEFFRRPDLVYQAIGPFASRADMARYTVERKEGKLAYDHDGLLEAEATFELVAKEVKFANGDCCGNAGIEDRLTSGAFGAPPRYFSGYSSFGQRVLLNWGSRVSRPKKLFGIGTDILVDHAFDLRGGGWWVFGGSTTIFWDPSRKWRVFSLNFDLRDSRPDGETEIPFTELPSLGGSRPLSGFLAGRLIDRSSIAITFEYKWPVASLLDGVFHFGVGNVFGIGFEGFSIPRLRKSFGLGIESVGNKASAFGLFVAIGSDVLERGGSFNEFRFSLRIGG